MPAWHFVSWHLPGKNDLAPNRNGKGLIALIKFFPALPQPKTVSRTTEGKKTTWPRIADKPYSRKMFHGRSCGSQQHFCDGTGIWNRKTGRGIKFSNRFS